jgi:DNA polymerase III alpha subunit
MKNFPSCHMHVGSLDTGSSIDAFIKRELELGTGYITTTDHGILGNCKTLYDEAKKNNLKPILGLEAYLRDDTCPILGQNNVPKTVHKDGTTSYTEYFKYGHITLHAKDQEAYQNLGRVLSRSYTHRTERHGSEIKPLFTWKDLEEFGQYNITAGSGCLIGVVQRHLLNDRPDIAEQYYLKAKSCFKPGNFFVEVFPHRCETKWEQGVFIEYKDGTKIRVHEAKKFKTDTADEVEATVLAKSFTAKKFTKILAIKNYRTWEDVNKEVLDVKHISGFIQNECTPFAPDGDVQLPANSLL